MLDAKDMMDEGAHKNMVGAIGALLNAQSMGGNTAGRIDDEHFGIVQGSTVRAKHVGRDLMATLKNLVGGELRGYTELLQDSRQEAMDRMGLQAKELGASSSLDR